MRTPPALGKLRCSETLVFPEHPSFTRLKWLIYTVKIKKKGSAAHSAVYQVCGWGVHKPIVARVVDFRCAITKNVLTLCAYWIWM